MRPPPKSDSDVGSGTGDEAAAFGTNRKERGSRQRPGYTHAHTLTS
jgi:hypothetical protein